MFSGGHGDHRLSADRCQIGEEIDHRSKTQKRDQATLNLWPGPYWLSAPVCLAYISSVITTERAHRMTRRAEVATAGSGIDGAGLELIF